jgi:hypothetical protein
VKATDTNSMRTCVLPIFTSLFDRDPSSQTWLRPLLALSRAAVPQDLGSIPAGAPRYFGYSEKALPAPHALLRWLVQHATASADPSVLGLGDTGDHRRGLLARDPDKIREALRLLDEQPSPRAWYVLAGPSYPDVFIETESAVVVIEGKRTEPAPTTRTTWMSRRDQRHIDAAWDLRGPRAVYGLLIVEGDSSAVAAVPKEWQSHVADLRTPVVLEANLPHRSAGDRQAIGEALLGVTTWQTLCGVLALPWPLVALKGIC